MILGWANRFFNVHRRRLGGPQSVASIQNLLQFCLDDQKIEFLGNEIATNKKNETIHET